MAFFIKTIVSFANSKIYEIIEVRASLHLDLFI